MFRVRAVNRPMRLGPRWHHGGTSAGCRSQRRRGRRRCWQKGEKQRGQSHGVRLLGTSSSRGRSISAFSIDTCPCPPRHRRLPAMECRSWTGRTSRPRDRRTATARSPQAPAVEAEQARAQRDDAAETRRPCRHLCCLRLMSTTMLAGLPFRHDGERQQSR